MLSLGGGLGVIAILFSPWSSFCKLTCVIVTVIISTKSSQPIRWWAFLSVTSSVVVVFVADHTLATASLVTVPLETERLEIVESFSEPLVVNSESVVVSSAAVTVVNGNS